MIRFIATLALVPTLALLIASCCSEYPEGVCPRVAPVSPGGPSEQPGGGPVTFPDTPLRPPPKGGVVRDVQIQGCNAPADCTKAAVQPACASGMTCDTNQPAPPPYAGVCVFRLAAGCTCYNGDVRYCDAMGVGSCHPPSVTGCGISTCSTTSVATGAWGSCVALPQPQGPCGHAGEACCGDACGPGSICSGGSCVACGVTGQACCAGACATGTCSGNTCVACGELGQQCCGSACNVGTCGASGQCACPAATTTCGATCTNLQTDPSNCGACGKSCSGGSNIMRYCVSGKCSPCPAGHMDCIR